MKERLETHGIAPEELLEQSKEAYAQNNYEAAYLFASAAYSEAVMDIEGHRQDPLVAVSAAAAACRLAAELSWPEEISVAWAVDGHDSLRVLPYDLRPQHGCHQLDEALYEAYQIHRARGTLRFKSTAGLPPPVLYRSVRVQFYGNTRTGHY